MEILKESDFRKEIKATPRLGYLLFGEEDYLKSFAVKTAREILCPDETFAFFNVMKLDALDFTPTKLIDALMPMPMGADRKLVTVTGLNFNAMRPNELEALCNALEALKEYDYNLLMISVASDCLDPGFLPKKPSATLTQLSEHLTPVAFDRCTPARLNAWVQKHFEHNGVHAEPDFCARMIDYCGRGMFRLANEIDKLSYYARFHQRSTVTDADLKTVCTPVTEYDAFAFANAIMDGKQEAALAILSEYRFRRMDPIFVLGDVIRVFCEMESIRLMQADGASAKEMSAVLKLHEFKVGLYQKSLARTSEQRLRRSIDACLAADTSLKLSPQGYAPLEQLICSI